MKSGTEIDNALRGAAADLEEIEVNAQFFREDNQNLPSSTLKMFEVLQEAASAGKIRLLRLVPEQDAIRECFPDA